MIEERLSELGIELAKEVPALGSYVPATVSGNLVFISGQLPVKDGELAFTGKVGSDLTVEQGYQAARLAAINGLSVISHTLEGLRQLSRIIKVTGYVASAPGFTEQHKVVNGASELFTDVLSERGRHARVAVGVPSLPMDSPVEIEIVAEFSPAAPGSSDISP
ncbi:MAG: RidA family protein [Candidatus Dadabacteria bacterium]|nr:RidA family protein [Candidatus Dadabacteria bacterium]MYA48903.1 RidA family protein [Candidatus Dadabacteria bacterium]MYF48266.1 RidA family protein [Candidatus Dadabacteria bacterium]MYG83087.1 RidA family protein [Candidatus Dadabacteria bacterium]MYK49081.1 RidA family protein [Candidatus Dadabacteria bacterium]